MIQMLACTYMLGAYMQLINLSLVIFPDKVFFFFFFFGGGGGKGLVKEYLPDLATWPHRYGLTVTRYLFSLHFPRAIPVYPTRRRTQTHPHTRTRANQDS